jgi:uncharacterized protein involved in propanediol utilization
MRHDIRSPGPRTIQERASRCPAYFKSVVVHGDLTQASTNTAQAITLFSLPALCGVYGIQHYLQTPFKDSADAALNTTTLVVGYSGTTAAFFASKELNENGTEIIFSYQTPTTSGIVSASAATDVIATFGSMAAKTLLQLDTGRVAIFTFTVDCGILDGNDEEDAV